MADSSQRSRKRKKKTILFVKICIRRFLGSLIMNPLSDFWNSKWRVHLVQIYLYRMFGTEFFVSTFRRVDLFLSNFRRIDFSPCPVFRVNFSACRVFNAEFSPCTADYNLHNLNLLLFVQIYLVQSCPRVQLFGVEFLCRVILVQSWWVQSRTATSPPLLQKVVVLVRNIREPSQSLHISRDVPWAIVISLPATCQQYPHYQLALHASQSRFSSFARSFVVGVLFRTMRPNGISNGIKLPKLKTL